jgi:hypothetical protein
VIYSYVQQRKFAEAQKFVEQSGLAPDDPWHSVLEAIVFGKWGHAAEALEALRKAERFPWKPEQRVEALVVVYSAVGRNEQSIALLQQAVVNHSNAVTALKVDPIYDPLRSDPRFQAVMRQAGLGDVGAAAKR